MNKVFHTVKQKKFWIPSVIIILLSVVIIANNRNPQDQVERGDTIKQVKVLTVNKQDSIKNTLELKGTIFPREYTRLVSNTQAQLQFLIPVGSSIKRGDSVAIMTDRRIEENFITASKSLSDIQANLLQTKSLNIESIKQAELSMISQENFLKLTQNNLETTKLLNEQNLTTSQDNARIAYQSSYNTIEEVVRFWGGGTITDFILKDSPTANQGLLKDGINSFQSVKELFSLIPSKPGHDIALSISLLEPPLDEIKDFNDLVLRILNFSLANSAKGFPQTLIDGYKQQAQIYVSQINTKNTALRNAKNSLINIILSNQTKLLSVENQLKQAEIQYDNTIALLESTKRQTEIREIGARSQLASAQTQVTAAKSQFDDLSLIAPFSGVVIAHRVSEGDQVYPGQELVEIGDNSGIEIELAIDEENGKHLKKGQTVRINNTETGVITEISPIASLRTGKINFTVQVDNNVGKFTPGDIAIVSLDISIDIPESIILPLSLITIAQNETFVLVVENSAVRKRTITLGELYDSQVAVKQGLEVGDQLVLKNGEFLNEGEEVEIKK